MKKTVEGHYVAKDADAGFGFGNMESSYGATNRYFTKDGEPVLPITGEFHFSRYDAELWETELEKIKAQGLDGVAVYVFWNHHEKEKGVFDFSGDNDIKRFLGLCKKLGLVCVLRIGPWCHGEVRYGGFPDYLRFAAGKRRSTKRYMEHVERFWRRVYDEVAEYCDGKTVIGIQLENEYWGSVSHIADLRKLAEEIGFKTPYFTMTAWPANKPDPRFVPMFGGYPSAPWTQHKRPLKAAGRFAIDRERNEEEIGEDLIKKKGKGADFSEYPFATCEIGTGNQVSNHRRPIISDKDGYGVAFAKFASGVNWLGYYMYHGGRNPAYRPLQETRRTGYPNNYPIVDYDFQAAMSKDGEVRKHGDRLRLLHYFIKSDEEFLAKSDAFFAKEGGMPYFSVRSDGERGYVFVGNYERGEKSGDCKLEFDVVINGSRAVLPEIEIKGGDMFFFPFNASYGGIRFDYITAQPIAAAEKGGKKYFYFMKPEGLKTVVSKDGKVEEVGKSFAAGDAELVFLEESEALKLYIIDGKVLFSDGPVYADADVCASS